MRNFVPAVTAFVFVVGGCGQSAPEAGSPTRSDAILGGAVSSATEIGATVSLFHHDPFFGGFFSMSVCSGTLIAPRVVVTAAHCIALIPPSELRVAVGSIVPIEAPPSQVFEIEAMVAHPEYAALGASSDDEAGLADTHDIGVVLLRTAAATAPAPVVAEQDYDARLTPGVELVIAGYGITVYPDTLQEHGELHTATTPFVRRAASEMLAGGPGLADVCTGDSGGPSSLLIDGALHLVGLTSRGPANAAECGEGGVYTLFGPHAAWVEEASAGAWLRPAPPPGDVVTTPDGGGDGGGAPDDSTAPDVEPGVEPDAPDPDAPDAPDAPSDGAPDDEPAAPPADAPEGGPTGDVGAGDLAPTAASCASADGTASLSLLGVLALISRGRRRR